MSLSVSILYGVKPSVRWMVPLYTREISEIILAMLQTIKKPKMREAISSQRFLLEILFVSDAEISEINETSMGCSGPTNVLSFPTSSSYLEESVQEYSLLTKNTMKQSLPELGTLIFAPKTLLRECFLYGQLPREHFIRLLAHGLVHLLGYDHGETMDTLCATMEQKALTLISHSFSKLPT